MNGTVTLRCINQTRANQDLLHCLPNNLGLNIRLAYVGPSGGDCVVRKIRQVGTSHLVEGNAAKLAESYFVVRKMAK